MGDFCLAVGRTIIAVGLSVSVICCATQKGWASPLDPASDTVSPFNPIIGPGQTPHGIQMPIGDIGRRIPIAADDLTLRIDIHGEPGGEAVAERMPIVTITRKAGATRDDADGSGDEGRGSTSPSRGKANTKDVLKTIARALPSPTRATDSGEYPRTRDLANDGNARLGYVLSLSGYPSQVLLDEVLVPLADFLLAPEFDEHGRISFSMLGLGDFFLEIAVDDRLPGGPLSFADLSWQGHGGISLYSYGDGFYYARRDQSNVVRPMTLKEVILNMLYELITLPVFYISIAGVFLVLAFTSSKRA